MASSSITFFPINPSLLNPQKKTLHKNFLTRVVANPNTIINLSSKPKSRTPISSSHCTTYKLQHIVSEFQSLPEPIDRVKRLLHYASILPVFDEELVRVPANRVTGCTMQVWVDVSMDELGRMRFMADSDSEIMKGFCSCLVWLLDGASPEEVLGLEIADLGVLNVGVNGKTRSRVNTWQNVLISMQRRTESTVSSKLGFDSLNHDLEAVAST